jgi:predicted acetyltransferase
LPLAAHNTDMPSVAIAPAGDDERVTIQNLFQLYAYDWSELLAMDVAEDGRFHVGSLDAYEQDERCHPFLLRVDGRVVGFALVCARSRLTGALDVFDMAEFFVLRRYRRQGIGSDAARALFDRFPGAWEIRQRAEHPEATRFWRDVITRYTNGAYEEVSWRDAHGNGPVQRFRAG